jgi:hypothetical protein
MFQEMMVIAMGAEAGDMVAAMPTILALVLIGGMNKHFK